MQYDLINNLAQASAGITFGQMARCDLDNVCIDLERAMSFKAKVVPLNVKVEDENEFLPPNRHQVVQVCLL